MKNRLFMICPAAHLETIIPGHFDGEAFFLTALGTAFQPLDSDDAAVINDFIENQRIGEICVVVDAFNPFLRNIILGKETHGTRPEKEFKALYAEQAAHLAKVKGAWNKCLELTKFHLAKQLDQLEETDRLGQKIAQGQLKVSGFIYFRKEQLMQEVTYRYGSLRVPAHR